jgi:hypothetical protein
MGGPGRGRAISYLVIKARDWWALCTWPRVCTVDSAMVRSKRDGDRQIDRGRKRKRDEDEAQGKRKGEMKSRGAVRRARLAERIGSKNDEKVYGGEKVQEGGKGRRRRADETGGRSARARRYGFRERRERERRAKGERRLPFQYTKSGYANPQSPALSPCCSAVLLSPESCFCYCSPPPRCLPRLLLSLTVLCRFVGRLPSHCARRLIYLRPRKVFNLMRCPLLRLP